MSEIDFESQVTSEDEVLGNQKVVPVSEAIRYRKRAQNAEKQIAEIEHKLSDSLRKEKQLSRQLDEIKLDQNLVARLSAAGTNDMEAAVLLARARMSESENADIESVVKQLKKEKSYLFEAVETTEAAAKTAGAKDRISGGQRVLENVAQRAAKSGSRVDLQEYLKVRRQFV